MFFFLYMHLAQAQDCTAEQFSQLCNEAKPVSCSIACENIESLLQEHTACTKEMLQPLCESEKKLETEPSAESPKDPLPKADSQTETITTTKTITATKTQTTPSQTAPPPKKKQKDTNTPQSPSPEQASPKSSSLSGLATIIISLLALGLSIRNYFGGQKMSTSAEKNLSIAKEMIDEMTKNEQKLRKDVMELRQENQGLKVRVQKLEAVIQKLSAKNKQLVDAIKQHSVQLKKNHESRNKTPSPTNQPSTRKEEPSGISFGTPTTHTQTTKPSKPFIKNLKSIELFWENEADELLSILPDLQFFTRKIANHFAHFFHELSNKDTSHEIINEIILPILDQVSLLLSRLTIADLNGQGDFEEQIQFLHECIYSDIGAEIQELNYGKLIEIRCLQTMFDDIRHMATSNMSIGSAYINKVVEVSHVGVIDIDGRKLLRKAEVKVGV